jgi:hypothetical protein
MGERQRLVRKCGCMARRQQSPDQELGLAGGAPPSSNHAAMHAPRCHQLAQESRQRKRPSRGLLESARGTLPTS